MTGPRRRVLVVGAEGPCRVAAEGLAVLGHEVLRSGESARRAEIVFVCGARDGEAVLAPVREHLRPGAVVVNSCCPPWESTYALRAGLRRGDLALISNPRQSECSTAQWLTPDAVVIGSDVDDAGDAVHSLYEGIAAPVVRTDVRSADLLPHAVNGCAAVKQSFFNDLAQLCDRLGVDITSVVRALSYDTRIGTSCTRPAPLSPAQRRSIEVLRAAAAEPGLLHAVAAAGTFPEEDACSPVGSLWWGPVTSG
ncbi:UDPglucose 6-dehydrogenase [Saccharopolyspora erythraea NRRL 2338]|uniref:UDP-glucose 6-dehydrogenase n=1 Tax=Saccharopolyspora erythraea TaxID=1836 RepID=A0ABP3NFX4_SACER|nr:UDP-glucose 6-dehydrogenase [Saccharopolyspora erythraea]PFG98392.1 UDPglucose 6-dehydrogenase [Saccharopolyspora erythraea NRRL 2338]QRK88462.1 UDP-glucose 6-dehydrogenase [Saccharopolyspora erythraea]